ncbi:MAG: hypothetical protein HY763_10935 [Planctomycetes bacterium]|nr:hypothetical protein [Planctomycetota bacterium]
MNDTLIACPSRIAARCALARAARQLAAEAARVAPQPVDELRELSFSQYPIFGSSAAELARAAVSLAWYCAANQVQGLEIDYSRNVAWAVAAQGRYEVVLPPAPATVDLPRLVLRATGAGEDRAGVIRIATPAGPVELTVRHEFLGGEPHVLLALAYEH